MKWNVSLALPETRFFRLYDDQWIVFRDIEIATQLIDTDRDKEKSNYWIRSLIEKVSGREERFRSVEPRESQGRRATD